MRNEISRETIERIQKLSAAEFEPAFIAHLATERKISLILVYFMRESYRRRDWARQYSSFSAYCTQRLRMSDSDFYRKFSLMKTIEELPDVEEKILEGSLQATTVAKMSHFFHREAKANGNSMSTDEKRDIFKKVEGLTLRQVERELATISPLSALPDKTRQITETTFIRQFTSNQELENKLARAKELLAHSLPQPPSDCQLISKIADITLERIDPILKANRSKSRGNDRREQSSTEHQSSPAVTEPLRPPAVAEPLRSPAGAGPLPSPGGAAPQRGKISEQLRRQVLERDSFACTHVNTETGKICESKYAIEIDHIKPVALGGDNSLGNLRVLCRTHNQLHALQTFGRSKMASHISTL